MRLVPCVVVMWACVVGAVARAAPLRFVDHAGAPVNVAWLPAGPPSLARPVGEDGILVQREGEPMPHCVGHQHFMPMRLTEEMLELGGDVVLRPARTAKGLVLSATGMPIPGITLRVVGDEAALGPCARRATSDAAGRLFLHGIGAQDDLVEVMAPPAWLAPPQVALAQAPGLATVVEMHPATAMALIVTGSDGKPLMGASVRVLPEWDRYPLDPPAWKELRESVASWKGTTDATGRVALALLPQRVIWRVVVEHPLHAPASVRAAAGKPSVEAALRLGEGGGIELRAVDEDGAPVKGAQARVMSSDGDDYDLVPPSAASGADGILRLARVPAGRVAVEVSVPGMRSSVARGVVVEGGRLASLGDLVLEPGAAIAGIVRSEAAPVERAGVRISGHGADGLVRCDVVTAADGTFRCDGLDPELRARVEVEAEWHLKETREGVLPGEIEIALRPAGALRVTARAEAAGDEIADVGAALRFGGETLHSPRPAPVDGAPSSLRFEPLAPGTYAVAAWAPGFGTAIVGEVGVIAGEETLVEVELERGRSVSGRVVEAASAKPIPGARLALGRAGTDAISDEDGHFTLDGISGPFRLIASHDSHPETVITVDPDSLPSEGLIVEMARGGSVEGIVVIITGDVSAPVAGASVQAEGDRRATTDADGRYRLDGLPPGSMQIVKTNRPGSLEGRETARAEIVAGQTVQVNFGVTGSLHGVVRLAGEPVAGATLGLMALPAPGTTDPRDMALAASEATRTDVDGRYILRGVSTGRHVLTITWAGRRLSRDVLMPLTHRHVELDIDIPELRVAGRVIAAATGEPVGGAVVSFSQPGGEPRQGFSTSMSESSDGDVPQELFMTTELQSSDRTAADGSFAVHLEAPGRHDVTAWAPEGDFEPWRGDAEVGASRDDMIIPLAAKRVTGKLVVSLVDATTGGTLAGGVQARYSEGGGGATTGGTEFRFDLPPEGQSVTLVAWSVGRAPEVREGIQSGSEGDIRIRIPMGPAGRLRLLAPEGSLPDAPEEASRLLHLRLASGFDLGPFLPTISLGNERHVTRVAPGEWLIGPLPPGPVLVSIGDGAPRTIDIPPGEIVELDVR